MARPINRLSARTVQTAAAGYHADGGGLYLLVTAQGTASWVFRYTFRGRKREMGLGAASLYSLAEARQRAAQQRRLLADGADPIEARRHAQTATPRTWGEARDAFIANRAAEWRNAKQAAQWSQSLRDYGPRDDLPMARLDTATVLICLRPLWKPSDQGGKVETATRIRGRMERIWDAEKVAGHVTGENPARWKGHLEHVLASPRKVQPPKHFAAMPYTALPAFMAKLRERDALTRKALEFAILTAARTEEVTGAQWSEFSGDLWSIPGHRMKMGEPHEVPLPARAVAILDSLPKDRPPFRLSANGMLTLLQNAPPKGFGLGYTVHGFRSSFFDWAHETTAFPKHVIDMALAHAIENKADAAYRRGALLAKRRELMEAWAAYLVASRP